jgi:hypothetical protein
LAESGQTYFIENNSSFVMRLLIPMFLVFTLPLAGTAQDVRSGETESHVDRLKGYFVGVEGDTTRVIFEIPFFRNAIDYERIQGTWIYRLKYIDSLGHRQVMSPWYTRMFCFQLPSGFNNELIKMIALTDWSKAKKHSQTGTFIKLQVDGKLKCFIQFHDSADKLGIRHGQFEKSYFYQKGDSEIVSIKATGFKKYISEYLPENPELVQKINNGTYSYQDIEQIAKAFNATINTK